MCTACSLNRQLEMDQMAELLYNKVGTISCRSPFSNLIFHKKCFSNLFQVGRFCFSLCIILYLYGDLAIYCTAVAKSLRDITCTATTGKGAGIHSPTPTAYRGRSRPMRMIVVPGSYQNYQNGAVSNQLTEAGRGIERECVWGDIESVDVWQSGCTIICTCHSLILSLHKSSIPLKMGSTKRRNLCTSLWTTGFCLSKIHK